MASELFYNYKLPSYRDIKTDLFVLGWTTLGKDVVAYGVNREGAPCKFVCKPSVAQTSLFVFASDVKYLSPLLHTQYYDVRRNITQVSGEFYVPPESLIHRLLQRDDSPLASIANTSIKEYNEHGEQRVKMFRVPTNSLSDAHSLHRTINSTAMRTFIHTTAVWSLELMVVLEMYTKCGHQLKDCTIYYTCLNEDITPSKEPFVPEIALLAFDIETVSSYHNRVPMGDARNDVLFSVSIVDHTNRELYSYINIPPGDKVVAKDGRDQDDSCCGKRIKTDRVYNLLTQNSQTRLQQKSINKRNVRVFNDELDLLRAVLKVFESKTRPYYLLGYNSKGYDMMFMMRRAAYLCMPELKHFWLDSGMPSYGRHMMHIDLLRIFRQLYTDVTDGHSLDKMAKLCLGSDEGKVIFSAKNLRYIYQIMLSSGVGVPENGRFEQFDIDLATVMHYNDKDTMLLCQLWDTLNYGTFLPQLYQSHLISPVRHTQCKIGEFINNKAVYRALLDGRRVLTLHKSSATKMVSAHNSRMVYRYNPTAVSAGVNENSYGGGFNMRHSRNVFFNVLVNDVVAYYPKLQEGFNISYETVSIVTVGALMRLEPYLDSNVPIKIFTFSIHKESKDETLNHKNARDLINELVNNCDEMTMQECKVKLSNYDRVMLMLGGNNNNNNNNNDDGGGERRKALLASLISKQNNLRDNAKKLRKQMKFIVSYLKCKVTGVEPSCKIVKKLKDVTPGQIEKYRNDDDLKILAPTGGFVPPSREIVDAAAAADNKETLTEIYNKFVGEHSRIESLYRGLKVENCSYYGLLGSNYGALIGRLVAAVTTALGRKYIINMARYSQRRNFDAVLIDTDSVFIHTPRANCLQTGSDALQEYIDSNPIAEYVRSINDKIEITTKLYEFLFVMAKKVYIAKYEGKYMSRGINKNGPEIWNTIIFTLTEKYLYNKTDLLALQLVSVLEEEVYMFIANVVRQDKSVVVCAMNPNLNNNSGSTPMAKMYRRTIDSEPGYVFDKRVRYFHLLQGKPTEVVFEPEHKLHCTPYDKLNLFKFISKINTAIYQILAKAVGDTNLRRNKCYATLTMSEFNCSSLVAFLNVNEKLHSWKV